MELRLCTKCGEEGEFYEGRNRHCKSCIRLATKVWKEANPEKVEAQRGRNKRQQAERVKRWRINNPERLAAYRDSGKNREASVRWRDANREEYRSRAREWARNHPEQAKAAVAKRRALKRGYEGPSHTPADVAACVKAQDGCCWYCGFRLPVKVHVDHLVPLSRGGGNGVDNIVLVCPPCNQSKGSKLLGLEWIPPLMKLLLDKNRYVV